MQIICPMIKGKSNSIKLKRDKPKINALEISNLDYTGIIMIKCRVFASCIHSMNSIRQACFGNDMR